MNLTAPRQWFPSAQPRAVHPALEQVGLAGLALYAAMLTLDKNAPYVGNLCLLGEWLMLLVLVVSWRVAGDRLLQDGIFRLLLLWAAYLGISCVVGSHRVPGSLGSQFFVARQWVKLGFIVLVAWWLGGDWRAIRRLYAVLFLAFAFLMLPYFLYPLYWQNGLAGNRLRFGMNPQRSGLFFGIALLGLLFLAHDVWGDRLKQHFRLRVALWGLAILLTTVGLLFTQTRGAWVGVATGLAATLPAILIARPHLKNRGLALGGIAVGVLLLIAVGVGQWPHIAARFGEENAVFQAIESGQWQNAPNTSLGIRLHLWHWGWSTWQESPWLGVGVGSVWPLMAVNDLPRQPDDTEFTHLHNSWLELLVSTGVVGVGLFLAFAVFSARGGWWAYRTGRLPGRFLLMQWAVFVMFVVANCSEAHITKWIFWPYLALFWGGLYSPAFWFRRPSPP
ncbi:MAG: O-antigen ligase family protein [Pseudomonadota bacterium]